MRTTAILDRIVIGGLVLCAVAAGVVVGRGGYVRHEIIPHLACVAVAALALLAFRTILGRDNSPAWWIAPIFGLLYPAMMGGLYDDPDLAIEVLQTVYINRRGTVTSSTALIGDDAHGDLARCLEAVVENWRFPETVGGDKRWGRWRLPLEPVAEQVTVCDGRFAGHLVLGNCIRGSRFHECWKRIAATSTGHSTDARISMTVGAGGRVVRSSVSSYGPVNADFERCVTIRLDELRFPRWSGAQDRTIDTNWTIDVDWTTYTR